MNLAWWNSRQSASGPNRRQASFRLAVEVLEDRLAPSSVAASTTHSPLQHSTPNLLATFRAFPDIHPGGPQGLLGGFLAIPAARGTGAFGVPPVLPTTTAANAGTITSVVGTGGLDPLSDWEEAGGLRRASFWHTSDSDGPVPSDTNESAPRENESRSPEAPERFLLLDNNLSSFAVGQEADPVQNSADVGVLFTVGQVSNSVQTTARIEILPYESDAALPQPAVQARISSSQQHASGSLVMILLLLSMRALYGNHSLRSVRLAGVSREMMLRRSPLSLWRGRVPRAEMCFGGSRGPPRNEYWSAKKGRQSCLPFFVLLTVGSMSVCH